MLASTLIVVVDSAYCLILISIIIMFCILKYKSVFVVRSVFCSCYCKAKRVFRPSKAFFSRPYSMSPCC